jgi:hypothetical protein
MTLRQSDRRTAPGYALIAPTPVVREDCLCDALNDRETDPGVLRRGKGGRRSHLTPSRQFVFL